MSASDALRRFAAAELDGWEGLPTGLSLADAGVVLPLEEGSAGRGFIGDDRLPARWVSAPSSLFAGGVRVWHDGADVLAIEARDPFAAGGEPLAAPEPGEPEARLDTYVGRLRLEGGELVYAARGLALRVNPENGVLLGAVAFAPTSVGEYRSRLRPQVDRQQLLPRPTAHGSVA